MATLIQLLSPVVFLLLMFLIQEIASRPSVADIYPEPARSESVSLCNPNVNGTCVTMLFYPSDNADVVSVVQHFADRNDPPLVIGDVDDWEADIWGFDDEDEMLSWVVGHKNTTQTVVKVLTQVETYYLDQYVQINSNTTLGSTFLFEVWHNYTLDVPYTVFDVETQMEAAYLSWQTGSEINMEVQSKDFPEIDVPSNPEFFANQFGVTFFYCAISFTTILMSVQINREKELGLRAGLKMMGLRDGVYLLSWFLHFAWIIALASVIVVATGILLDFSFFANTNVVVSFLMFFCFGVAMVAFTLFLTTQFDTVRAVVLAGIVVFLMGIVLLSIFFAQTGAGVLAMFMYGNVKPGYKWLMYIYPPFHFGRMYNDILPATISPYDALTDTFGEAITFQWQNLSQVPYGFRLDASEENDPNSIKLPNVNASLLLLLADTVIFGFLAWFSDKVFSGASTKVRPIWFLCSPYYWGCARSTPRYAPVGADGGGDEIGDEDVRAETAMIAEGAADDNERIGLVVRDLHMTYGGWLSQKKRAVRGLSFTAEVGKCFALLGHNGAGKTTAIKVLTGLVDGTYGDATLFGLDILNDMDDIRHFTSVCPQVP